MKTQTEPQLIRFLDACDEFIKREHIKETQLSSRIFEDAKVIRSLREGKTMTVRRLNQAARKLSNMWPDDIAWPEGIECPQLEEPAE